MCTSWLVISVPSLSIGTAASALFSPTDISSLSFWIDASDARTITQSSNQVSQWNDKSANAYNLSQATSANMPLTNQATKNGLNVISFDGINDRISNASSDLFRNVSGWSVFVVTQILAPTSACRPWGKYVPGGAGNLTKSSFQSNRSASQYSSLARRLDADASNNVVSSTNTSNAWVLLGQICNFTAGTHTLRINKSVANSGSIGTGTSSNTAGGIITAGARSDGAEFMEGYVAEVVAYNKNLSSDETSLIESYLTSKWGL